MSRFASTMAFVGAAFFSASAAAPVTLPAGYDPMARLLANKTPGGPTANSGKAADCVLIPAGGGQGVRIANHARYTVVGQHGEHRVYACTNGVLHQVI
jgi:hypothetical protein